MELNSEGELEPPSEGTTTHTAHCCRPYSGAVLESVAPSVSAASLPEIAQKDATENDVEEEDHDDEDRSGRNCPRKAGGSGIHLARRLDIKLYPPSQFAFALLYFTGSDYFNRSMRLYAQQRGLGLSDKELKPIVRVGGERVHETCRGVDCETERDVFTALGLPYKEPAERDV
jgi:DNA polymerase/3'-5' exonuclease PolX